MTTQNNQPWYKQLWAVVLGLFSILVGMFLYEQKKRKQAELKANTIETTLKDEALETNKASKNASIKTNEMTLADLEKAKKEANEELKAKTKKEVEDFYSKKLK